MESFIRLAFYRILFTLPVGLQVIIIGSFVIQDFYFHINIQKFGSLLTFIYVISVLIIGEAFSSIGEIILSFLFFNFSFNVDHGFKEKVFPKLYPKMRNREFTLQTLKELYKTEDKTPIEISEIHYSLSRLWAGSFASSLFYIAGLAVDYMTKNFDILCCPKTNEISMASIITILSVAYILIRNLSILAISMFLIMANIEEIQRFLNFGSIIFLIGLSISIFQKSTFFILLFVLLISMILFCYHRTVANIYLVEY